MMKLQILLACCAALTLGVTELSAQEQRRAADVASNASNELSTNVVFLAWQGNPDVQSCGLCHYSPGNQFSTRDTDFCRLVELKQWLAEDKHAIARQRVEPVAPADTDTALARIAASLQQHVRQPIQVPRHWIGPSNYLSYSMCQKLGYDITTDRGYATFRDNCLTCHGGYQRSSELDAGNRVGEGSDQERAFSRQSTNQPGISCTTCHQLGNNRQWIDMHSGLDAKEKWRSEPPAFKSLKGMRHLASAGAQAELCTNCHIGDIEKGMFVTHEMYAAGHPVLPGVELATMVEAMPRHWRNPKQLATSMQDAAQRTAYFQSAYFADHARFNPQTGLDRLPWQTDAMMTGSLVAQQTYLRLLQNAAAPQSKHWGDYALYDCGACHHELRLPSQRQALRSPGAPGRPRLPEWPQALPTAIAVVGGASAGSIAAQFQELRQAVTERPFGDRAKVAAAAGNVQSALGQLRTSVGNSLNSEQMPLALLRALTQTPADLLVDYHAARQVNWAVRTIDTELAELNRPLPPATRAAIARLGMSEQRSADNQPIENISRQLPSGQGRTIVPDFQAAELKRQIDYDSNAFIKQLRAITLQ